MYPEHQTLPGQLPPPRDYHALLHAQIYDYFLSAEMFTCGQALLNSDCNLQHELMSYTDRQSTAELHDTTPSLLDSGFGSSHSSPNDWPCFTAQEDSLRPELHPAPLYQWFCTFWDTFNAPQNGGVGTTMQDCSGFPANLSQTPPDSEPTTWQASLNFQPCPNILDPPPRDIATLKSHPSNWRPISPHSDSASLISRKGSDNMVRLLSFQKGLGELIRQNEGIVKSLRSNPKTKPMINSPEQSEAL